MKRILDTRNCDKKTWLLARKKGLTGTDAAAIMGLNPYSSAFQIYQDKINPDVEMYDNERLRQGRDFEEYVARRFCEETGLKVRRANALFQSDDYPFMLADFDRLIVGENAGLECKTVSPYASSNWKDGNVPLHYLLQCQHYIAVSGAEKWFIAGLILGEGLVIHEIQRDEEMIQNLITIEERFWNENVIRRVMPEPDGTKSCAEQISKMYFKADGETTIDLLGFDDALKRREELVQLIDKLDKEKATIDQKIQLQLQDSCFGVAGDFKVSWLPTETKRLDTKKLKEEHPEIYDEYTKNIRCRRFLVKRVA